MRLCGRLSGWRAWRSRSSARKLNSSRRMTRKNGQDLRSPWTSRFVVIFFAAGTSHFECVLDYHFFWWFFYTGFIHLPSIDWLIDRCIDQCLIWFFIVSNHLSLLLSSKGSICAIWTESALPQSLRVKVELQRPRRHQMGPLHWPQWAVRDQVLRFSR